AVVALLVGITLPALGIAIRAARTSKCLSQTRDIVLAVANDAASNGDLLPENRTRINETEHVTWRHRFVETARVPSAEAFVCPLHPGEPLSEVGQPDHETVCVGDVPSSYALNGHLLWRRSVNGREAIRRVSSVSRPAHTILLAESRARFPDIRVTNQLVAADDELGGFYGFWHSGDGVYGFIDGHAETINFMDTGSPDCRWHDGRDMNDDPFSPQSRAELRPHDHPDWEYLAHPVYFD
ncbi:MAG: hypothetical protein AAFU70_09920, partial [Planctomycetota bacterium]